MTTGLPSSLAFIVLVGLNSVRIERFEGHAAEVVAFRDEVDFGLGFGPFGRYGPGWIRTPDEPRYRGDTAVESVTMSSTSRLMPP